MSKYFYYFFIPLFLFLTFFKLFQSFSFDNRSLFYIDEYDWIGRSYYLDLLLHKNLSYKVWDTYGIDGDPKLASYIDGLFILPLYLKEKSTKKGEYNMLHFLIDRGFFTYYLMNRDTYLQYRKYLTNNRYEFRNYSINQKKISLDDLTKKYGKDFIKTIDIIKKARLSNFIFMTLSVIVIYLLSYLLLKKWPLSVLVSVLFGISRLIVSSSIPAYTEAYFIFFLYFGSLLIMRVFSTKKPSFMTLLLFVILATLCAQSKLNGVLLMLLFNFYLILYFIIQKKVVNFFNGLFINFLFILFFILLDPFTYANPVKNILFKYNWTYQIAKTQQRLYPNQALTTIRDRIFYINDSLWRVNKNASPIIVPYFLKNTVLTKIIFVKTTLLFYVFGLLSLSLCAIKEIKLLVLSKSNLSMQTIFFINYLLIIFLLFGYLMMAWERYLAHIIFPVFLIAAYGLSRILRLFHLKSRVRSQC